VIADLLERLRALVFRSRWQRDLDEEIRFHLEQDEAARVRAGADPAAARREALLAFGGVEQVREATLDASGVRPLHDLAADVRFTLRGLRRNPGFTATAILVLALAIGAATAVFGVVRTVLLSDLPYPHADRLVRVYQQNSPTNRWTLSVVDVQAIREQQLSFDAFGAARVGVAGLAGGGVPEQVPVVWVTSGLFSALGTRPAAGRLIEVGDERPDALPVVVVSARLAAERLGGVRAAVGRTLSLDGVSHTVIGVLPSELDELAGMRAAAWPVLKTTTPTRRGPFGLRGIGRLKPEVALDGATRDLAGISERLYPLWRAGFRDSVARLTPYPLRDTIVGGATQQLRLFAGAVLLVLVGALANVATLLLVRVSSRGHELAVRATLGASRLRVARLVLTEGLVLAALATLAAIGVAALGLRLVNAIAPHLPRAHEIVLDARAVAVAVALGVTSGLLVSLSPVAAVLGGRLVSLRAEGRRAGGTRWTGTVRGVLVAAEFALAIPLLMAAALLANSLLRLQRVDPGYDVGSSFTVWLAPPPVRYPDTTAVRTFWRRAVAAALETPGVVAAGLATSAPPDNQGDVNNFNLVAHPVPEGGAEPTSPWSSVTPGFFAALGIPLLEGRLFTEADSANAPPVAIVSRSWASHYFPRERDRAADGRGWVLRVPPNDHRRHRGRREVPGPGRERRGGVRAAAPVGVPQRGVVRADRRRAPKRHRPGAPAPQGHGSRAAALGPSHDRRAAPRARRSGPVDGRAVGFRGGGARALGAGDLRARVLPGAAAAAGDRRAARAGRRAAHHPADGPRRRHALRDRGNPGRPRPHGGERALAGLAAVRGGAERSDHHGRRHGDVVDRRAGGVPRPGSPGCPDSADRGDGRGVAAHAVPSTSFRNRGLLRSGSNSGSIRSQAGVSEYGMASSGSSASSARSVSPARR
jgi:putative ABC transport system permease protein